MLSDAYASAVNAGVSIDVLGAAGMVGQRHSLGMLLQRLRADQSQVLLASVHEALARRLQEAVRRRAVRRAGQHAGDVVRDALTWWLESTCEECGGVRWRVRQRRLTDVACESCSATGLRALHGEAVSWVVSLVERLVSESEEAHRRAMG